MCRQNHTIKGRRLFLPYIAQYDYTNILKINSVRFIIIEIVNGF